MSISLGFHYHVPAVQDGSCIRMPGYLGVFVDSLARKCKQVVCFLHTPRSKERQFLDYEIKSSNVRLVDVGLHRSIPLRTLLSTFHTRPLKDWRNHLDAMLIRGPTPLLSQVARAVKPVPVALLLVGDYLAGIDFLPQPAWRKELIRLWSARNYQGQLRMAKQGLTFVNSHELYSNLVDKIPSLIEMQTTTLSQDDFFKRVDTCENLPIRLLYTGRFDRTKGLIEIVKALGLLNSWDEDVVLDLVGWPDSKDPILEDLRELAVRMGILDRLIFSGYRPLGPTLFECYRQADIFVIASKVEGFPRTIWEAMASSLPVVATRVGSIPDFIDDAATLIPPNDPEALARAIQRLIHDPQLRQGLIQRGFALAQQNTLEVRANQMIRQLEGWLSKRQ